MKVLYTSLLTLFLACSYTTMAQTTNDKPKQEKLTDGPEYDKHYAKLKELYLKQLRSESYKKQHALNNAFVAKINFDGEIEDFQKDILGWIKANIDKTTFGSYEAAEKEWQAIIAAGMKDFEENKDYYDYMMVCFNCCDSEILTQVMMEVMEEYPELVYGE
jgi:hypothetical protein